MKPTLRIMFVGNGPYLNHGCEAIVRGTTTMLRKKLGNDTEFINALYANPDVVSRQNEGEVDPAIHSVGIEKPSRLTSGFVGRVIRRLRIDVPDRLSAMDPFLQATSIGLELGGDNYSLCYGQRVLKRYINLDHYLWDKGLPVVLWGASVGPFSDEPEIEAEMRDHLRRMSLILVRETESQSYLASIGVEENVRLVADPAFAMEPREPHMSGELRGFIDQKPIGVNLSPLVALYRSDGTRGWDAVALEYVRLLLDSNLGPVLLVPHVVIPGHDDYEFMSSMVAQLPGLEDKLAILPSTFGAAEYKWVISRLSALVAARTHVTIAGFSEAVPTLSIGYSAKAIGINKDMYGHTDWCLPVADCTPEILLEKTRHLLREADHLREHLTTTAQVMWKRAYSAADCLLPIIRRSS